MSKIKRPPKKPQIKIQHFPPRYADGYAPVNKICLPETSLGGFFDSDIIKKF